MHNVDYPLNELLLWQALSMDAIVNVVGNNITAETTLNDLNLELKWSDIGKFPVNLLQVSLLESEAYLQIGLKYLPIFSFFCDKRLCTWTCNTS